MEIKKYINDLKLVYSINTQFQNRLGEITIWLNNIIKTKEILKISPDLLKIFLTNIQTFLCHNFYKDFMSKKTSENTTYDNCMNLIIIILTKISKLNDEYIKLMFDNFFIHLNTHLECFNYIISFYRLYMPNNNMKLVGKNFGIFNYLFEIYKKMFNNEFKLEFKKFNKSSDKKYLYDNYIQLTDRPNNIYNNNNSNDGGGNNSNNSGNNKKNKN